MVIQSCIQLGNDVVLKIKIFEAISWPILPMTAVASYLEDQIFWCWGFFPLCCVVAAEGVQFWWVSTWSLSLYWLYYPSRPLPQTFVLPQALQRAVQSSCVPCHCQEQITSSLSSFMGALQSLMLLVPCLISLLPFIQKCPIQPLDKQVVPSFWRELDFTLEANQAVIWHKALLLP